MSISLKASTAFRISQEDSSFASTSESCCCWACIADPSPSLNLLLGTLLRLPYACNDRGRLALSFLRRQGLCSVSSFFQQKNKTTHTYVHHGSQTQSPDLEQTDFVLTPFSELKRVQQYVSSMMVWSLATIEESSRHWKSFQRSQRRGVSNLEQSGVTGFNFVTMNKSVNNTILPSHMSSHYSMTRPILLQYLAK